MVTGPNPTAIDVIDRIPRKNRQHERVRPLTHVQNLFAHFTVSSVPATATVEQEVAHLIGLTRFHQGKDWSPPNKVYGFTLMYTYAVFQSGRLYLVNPENMLLWNTTYGNPWGLATVAILGASERPSEAMLATFERHFDYMANRTDIPARRDNVWGHGECGRIYGGGPDFKNNTNCPGGLLPFVKAYRNKKKGVPVVTAPTPITEAPKPRNRKFPTNHYVSNAFLDKWEAYEGVKIPGGTNAAMELIGYPLTEELYDFQIGTWRGTVQFFERARMEWHPENQEPYKVQFGLLGAEYQAHILNAHHEGCGCDEDAGKAA